MRAISDYNFGNSWVLAAMGLRPEAECAVTADVGDLRAGSVVRFLGFDDVDNHHGIFVFSDDSGRGLLEVSGDFSSDAHSAFRALKASLRISEL